MSALADLLSQFGIATGLATDVTRYALVSALHIFGIGLLIGAIMPVCLSMLGLARSLNQPVLLLLRRYAAAGLALALLTGTLLLSTKPREYLANPVVLLKLAVVGAGICHAVLFHLARWALTKGEMAIAMSGAAALLLWLSALVLGRWIAFSV